MATTTTTTATTAAMIAQKARGGWYRLALFAPGAKLAGGSAGGGGYGGGSLMTWKSTPAARGPPSHAVGYRRLGVERIDHRLIERFRCGVHLAEVVGVDLRVVRIDRLHVRLDSVGVAGNDGVQQLADIGRECLEVGQEELHLRWQPRRARELDGHRDV